jgi:hypothetical protein
METTMQKTWTTRCGTSSCVEISETDGGYRVTSSIPGNDGSVEFTPAEMAEFLDEVVMGNFGELRARAKQRAATARAAATVA